MTNEQRASEWLRCNCDVYSYGDEEGVQSLAALLDAVEREAVAREREKLAGLCDSMARSQSNRAADCAAAIRGVCQFGAIPRRQQ